MSAPSSLGAKPIDGSVVTQPASVPVGLATSRAPFSTSYRFDTVLRFRYREFSRENAMPCEALRNTDHASKLLIGKNFREFRHGIRSIFPSWTSSVRIRSPAVKRKISAERYLSMPACVPAKPPRQTYVRIWPDRGTSAINRRARTANQKNPPAKRRNCRDVRDRRAGDRGRRDVPAVERPY